MRELVSQSAILLGRELVPKSANLLGRLKEESGVIYFILNIETQVLRSEQ